MPSLSTVSKRVYQNRGTVLDDANQEPTWNRTAVHGGINYTINREHSYFVKELQNFTPSHQKRIMNLFQIIESGLPLDALFFDLNSNPTNTHNSHLDLAVLKDLVEMTAKRYQANGLSVSEASALMQMMEPFKEQWVDVEPILNQHFKGMSHS